MGKHLLIYDVDWWILGYKARIIQQYHPNLQIISQHDMKQLIKEKGAKAINRSYDVISTLSVGIAAYLLKKNVRVDSSQVGGYNYISKNIDTYREWCDAIVRNDVFIENVLKKINRLGAINPNLAKVVAQMAPNSNVDYIRHFVDSNHFRPLKTKRSSEKLVVGWVGNKKRIGKNYETLYQPIVQAFAKDRSVTFVEATKENIKSMEQMPQLYNSLDLLLITSANEGGPAPAMEAYACGVPVLSTNVGYVKATAPKEGHDFILNSDDPNDFVEKIHYLNKNRSVLKRLKDSGRKNITEHWTIEKTMDDWLKSLFDI